MLKISADYDVEVYIHKTDLGITLKLMRPGAEDPAFLTPDQAREVGIELIALARMTDRGEEDA